MKSTKYQGTFISSDNDVYDVYTLETSCGGFIQALFLLTAKAIASGKHYQLSYIVDEKGNTKLVDNILNASSLLIETN